MTVYKVYELELKKGNQKRFYRTDNIETYLAGMPFGNDVEIINQEIIDCIGGRCAKVDSLYELVGDEHSFPRRIFGKNLVDWYFYTEEEIIKALGEDRFVFINGFGEVKKDNVEVVKEMFVNSNC